MAVAISVPRDDSPQQLYERERHLAAQRALYDWDRRPGLPPTCKGVPAPERFSRSSAYEFLSDAAESVASGVLSVFPIVTAILAVFRLPPRPSSRHGQP